MRTIRTLAIVAKQAQQLAQAILFCNRGLYSASRQPGRLSLAHPLTPRTILEAKAVVVAERPVLGKHSLSHHAGEVRKPLWESLKR
jgi:hypothetical protein